MILNVDTCRCTAIEKPCHKKQDCLRYLHENPKGMAWASYADFSLDMDEHGECDFFISNHSHI